MPTKEYIYCKKITCKKFFDTLTRFRLHVIEQHPGYYPCIAKNPHAVEDASDLNGVYTKASLQKHLVHAHPNAPLDKLFIKPSKPGAKNTRYIWNRVELRNRLMARLESEVENLSGDQQNAATGSTSESATATSSAPQAATEASAEPSNALQFALNDGRLIKIFPRKSIPVPHATAVVVNVKGNGKIFGARRLEQRATYTVDVKATNLMSKPSTSAEFQIAKNSSAKTCAKPAAPTTIYRPSKQFASYNGSPVEIFRNTDSIPHATAVIIDAERNEEVVGTMRLDQPASYSADAESIPDRMAKTIAINSEPSTPTEFQVAKHSNAKTHAEATSHVLVTAIEQPGLRFLTQLRMPEKVKSKLKSLTFKVRLISTTEDPGAAIAQFVSDEATHAAATDESKRKKQPNARRASSLN